MSCPQSGIEDDAIHGLAVYCVGGAVRDARLGIDSVDRDWVVVGATVDAMLARGFRQVGRDFPVFLHPRTHEEYALARTERKAGRGYTGFEVYADPTVTLEDDLRRRDLTINAMACDANGALIDPFGGAADCDAKVLRHVSAAFGEDPLRVLRAARFLARFADRGFRLAEETRAMMAIMVARGEMHDLVAERVWQETERVLSEPKPQACFAVLSDCGALSVLMPMLDARVDEALARLSAGSVVDAEQRFALLMSVLAEADIETQCQALRVPNAFRTLALQLVCSLRWLTQDAEASPPAAAIAEWLNAIDGWRRPERVPRLLATLGCLTLDARPPDSRSLDSQHAGFPAQGLDLARLERAHQAARAVSPQSLMQEGYRGAELGRMIGVRRRQAIERAIG